MPLSVIGAGLGRTGTMSLKLALETLGFAPCHHMLDLILHPEGVAPWVRAASGGAVDWDEVFVGYRATTDWPACHFYKELTARYPRAQVILTVRDARRWYESTQATIFSDEVLKSDEDRPMSEFIRSALLPFFGGDLHDRERMVAAYERHNAEVRRAVPAERLLVYELADGWEPLCRFLGVPIPDQPFPRSNSTEDFLRMVRSDEGDASKPSPASNP
ncbi:MAG: sulfotransferase family protein [Steroidobacteraceae bacterium]